MFDESTGRLRVGHGFDVHQLVPGRRLVLGGVEITHHKGLAGHSDADVLLHATADALLGAAALGDIGQHFPPSDDKHKDVDSGELLIKVLGKVQAVGFGTVINLDCTIMAEHPQMAPHIKAMRANVARLLGIDMSAVNVKATTCERLGFVGREEGIAASTVCLIVADE